MIVNVEQSGMMFTVPVGRLVGISSLLEVG